MKYSVVILMLVFCFSLKAQKSAKMPVDKTDENKQMPHFKGGENAFFEYLDKNVKTPDGFDNVTYVKEHGNQYVPVSVYFTVDVDGSITDVNVLEKVDETLDKKAIEIVRNMPKWEPGTENGKPIKVQYAIPVRFNLK